MARGRRAPLAGRMIAPEPTTVDLHAHTSRSDGLLAPLDLVRAAAAAGVRTLAITDHDTVAGYRELGAGGSEPLPAGIAVVPGVEINTVSRTHLDLPDGELHVVGLGIDPDHAGLEAALADQRGRRRARFVAMMRRLRDGGWAVDAQLEGLDLARDDALGRPTLARALVSAGHATSVPDAFARLVGHGCPGYVPRDGLDPTGAIRVIREAGGLAVLAHFAPAFQRLDLLRDLMTLGLGGLEVHHRSFDAEIVASVGRAARTLGLVASGGTDYHGDDEPYAEALAETWVPASVADGVFAALDGLRATRTSPAERADGAVADADEADRGGTASAEAASAEAASVITAGTEAVSAGAAAGAPRP